MFLHEKYLLDNVTHSIENSSCGELIKTVQGHKFENTKTGHKCSTALPWLERNSNITNTLCVTDEQARHRYMYVLHNNESTQLLSYYFKRKENSVNQPDDFRHTTDIGYLGGKRTGNTCFSV